MSLLQKRDNPSPSNSGFFWLQPINNHADSFHPVRPACFITHWVVDGLPVSLRLPLWILYPFLYPLHVQKVKP